MHVFIRSYIFTFTFEQTYRGIFEGRRIFIDGDGINDAFRTPYLIFLRVRINPCCIPALCLTLAPLTLFSTCKHSEAHRFTESFRVVQLSLNIQNWKEFENKVRNRMHVCVYLSAAGQLALFFSLGRRVHFVARESLISRAL